MRRVTQFLPAAILIVLTLSLSGCHGGSAEVRYANRKNPKEVLTLKTSMTVKTQLIHTFHGMSNGTYSLKTESGTTSGTFAENRGAYKFRSEDGKSETAKINDDGSFDYGQGTWELQDKNTKLVQKVEKTGN